MMRLLFLPVFMAVSALICPAVGSADTGLDSFLILADEADKKKDKQADEKDTGDEEPECE